MYKDVSVYAYKPHRNSLYFDHRPNLTNAIVTVTLHILFSNRIYVKIVCAFSSYPLRKF